MSPEEQAAVRGRFLAALADPDHPVWDRLLNGFDDWSTTGRGVGIVPMMDRHPFGHDCGVCRAWRRQNPELADIERQVLDRRAAREAA